MQTEPLLSIQQKGMGERQGREGKKWGKQWLEQNTHTPMTPEKSSDSSRPWGTSECTQNEYSPALTLSSKTVTFVCRKKQVNGNCLTSTGTWQALLIKCSFLLKIYSKENKLPIHFSVKNSCRLWKQCLSYNSTPLSEELCLPITRNRTDPTRIYQTPALKN